MTLELGGGEFKKLNIRRGEIHSKRSVDINVGLTI